jgi:hypothetical protein
MVSGPSLPALTPITIRNPITGYLRTDNITFPGYFFNGNGSAPCEHYVAMNASDPGNPDPITAGSMIIMQSKLTGKFCRLNPHIVNLTTLQLALLCDQPTIGLAMQFNYTGGRRGWWHWHVACMPGCLSHQACLRGACNASAAAASVTHLCHYKSHLLTFQFSLRPCPPPPLQATA